MHAEACRNDVNTFYPGVSGRSHRTAFLISASFTDGRRSVTSVYIRSIWEQAEHQVSVSLDGFFRPDLSAHPADADTGSC